MTAKPRNRRKPGVRRVLEATESMRRRDGVWVHEMVLTVHDTMHDTLGVEVFTRQPSPAEVSAFVELEDTDTGRVLS